MKIKVLTIHRHRLRNFAMLGHLETVGVPVVPMLENGGLTFYEGYDYREEDKKKIEAIVRWYKQRGIQGKPRPTNAARAIEWGFYCILEKIASEDEPSLVLECDARLQCSWSELNEHWKTLCDSQGYDRIKLIQLRHSNSKLACEKATDVFQRGGGCGQMGNIWTPHGAEFLLTDKNWNSHIATLENLPFIYPFGKGLYSAINAMVTHSKVAGMFYNQQSRGISAADKSFVKKVFGECLFAFNKLKTKEVRNMVSTEERIAFFQSSSEQLKSLTADFVNFQKKVDADGNEEPGSEFSDFLDKSQRTLQGMLGDVIVKQAVLEKETE